MERTFEINRENAGICVDHINTMDSTGELLIPIVSSQAQEESQNLGENICWGSARKFEKGIVHVNHTKYMVTKR